MSDSDDDRPPPLRQNTGTFSSADQLSPRRWDGNASGMLSPTFIGDRGVSFRLLASNSFSFNRVASGAALDASGTFMSQPISRSPQEIVRAASSSLRHYISDHGVVSVTDTAIPVNIRQGPKIGSGGYATVYSGINTINGELVAIKVLQVGASSPQQFDDVAAEFGLLRKLKHPNIIRYLLFEHSISQQVCRIVMELMAGGSASTLLQHFGKLSEPVLRGYVTQMLAGLDFIHENGITHRDIKPANILLHSSGAVKLADFGCSRLINSKTALTKDLLGTPVYMAPEAIKGRLHQKSDIWAIGCTMLELATGRKPWQETGITEYLPLMFHITSVNRGPEIPSTVSRSLRDFLEQCFITDPDERPSAASLLIHHWLTEVENEDDYTQEVMSSIGAQQTAALVDTLTTEGLSTPFAEPDKDVPQQLMVQIDERESGAAAICSSPAAVSPSSEPVAPQTSDAESLLIRHQSAMKVSGTMHVRFPVDTGGRRMSVELEVQPNDVELRIVDRRPSFVLALSDDVKHQLACAMDQLSSIRGNGTPPQNPSSETSPMLPKIVLDDAAEEISSTESRSPKRSPSSLQSQHKLSTADMARLS